MCVRIGPLHSDKGEEGRGAEKTAERTGHSLGKLARLAEAVVRPGPESTQPSWMEPVPVREAAMESSDTPPGTTYTRVYLARPQGRALLSASRWGTNRDHEMLLPTPSPGQGSRSDGTELAEAGRWPGRCHGYLGT